MNLLHWFTPVQFPAPAELKYDWFSLSHLKPAGDSFSALIARISLPLSFSVTSLWAQEIVGICTFFQASDDTNIFRLDGAEGLRRRHLECPGITSSLMMPLNASSESLMGNRVGNGMKTGNLGADKKKKLNWIFFCYVDSFGDGFGFNHPVSLENFYPRDFQKSGLWWQNPGNTNL